MELAKKSGLNIRALVFFSLLFSSIIMIDSGALLDGVSGMHQLEFISRMFHKVSVCVFFIATFFHLYFNWRATVNYIKRRGSGFKHKKEFIATCAFLSALLTLSLIYGT